MTVEPRGRSDNMRSQKSREPIERPTSYYGTSCGRTTLTGSDPAAETRCSETEAGSKGQTGTQIPLLQFVWRSDGQGHAVGGVVQGVLQRRGTGSRWHKH